MQDFIVLGLIPGTNIELTFTFWLLMATAGLAVIMLRILQRNHFFRNSLITLAVALYSRRTASVLQ